MVSIQFSTNNSVSVYFRTHNSTPSLLNLVWLEEGRKFHSHSTRRFIFKISFAEIKTFYRLGGLVHTTRTRRDGIHGPAGCITNLDGNSSASAPNRPWSRARPRTGPGVRRSPAFRVPSSDHSDSPSRPVTEAWRQSRQRRADPSHGPPGADSPKGRLGPSPSRTVGLPGGAAAACP
jgi:hypothetical protein